MSKAGNRESTDQTELAALSPQRPFDQGYAPTAG